jgi:hypothetical protein
MMIQAVPPPYAFDYTYNDALTTVDDIPQSEISYPDYYASTCDPDEEDIPTTQTFQDNCPLEFGKHKGRTPIELLTIDPGWLAWAHKNVDPDRKTWSEELGEKATVKAASLPKLRR